MNPTVVKAADAAQFLSFLPRMLGYRPRRSLVVVPFDGNRSLGVMRFDLPDDDPDVVDPIAATVVGMVCRLPAADAVAAVAYADAAFHDEGRMPHRALLEALDRRAHACGLRVTDLLTVGSDAWGSALDPDCPPEGRPLGELETDTVMPAEVPEPDGDQATGAVLPRCSADERERVARALDALDRAVGVLCGPEAAGGGTATRTGSSARAACAVRGESSSGPTTVGVEPAPRAGASDLGPVPAALPGPEDDEASDSASERLDPRALVAVCRLDDLPRFYEDLLTGDPALSDSYAAAALVWCLSRPSLRDVALVQWSGDAGQGDEALDAQLRWEEGAEYPAHLAMRMWGDGERPSVTRMETALDLARRAAAVAPRDSQPGPLAMCAWLSWALGRSTHAALYAERACEVDPEHGLSQIVLSFVQAGHLPDWAFRSAGAR